jgi:N6-adenosine-specific RNA methylase IME4
MAEVIQAPRGAGKFREKPATFSEMNEAYFPNLPKIELNCRGKPQPGWDGWGAEAEEGLRRARERTPFTLHHNLRRRSSFCIRLG